jgi:hypothetical protein
MATSSCAQAQVNEILHGYWRRYWADDLWLLVLKHPIPISVSSAMDAGVGSGVEHTLEGRAIAELHGEIEIGVRLRLLTATMVQNIAVGRSGLLQI